VRNRPAATNVVIIDGAVPNYESLINSIGGSVSVGTGVTAVILPQMIAVYWHESV
jgi:hypothetical protein